jgi:hypothetical protein
MPGSVASGTLCIYIYIYSICSRDKSVSVKMAWRILRLQMDERPPIWMAATNILNKLLRKADNGWYFSLGEVLDMVYGI